MLTGSVAMSVAARKDFEVLTSFRALMTSQIVIIEWVLLFCFVDIVLHQVMMMLSDSELKQVILIAFISFIISMRWEVAKGFSSSLVLLMRLRHC